MSAGPRRSGILRYFGWGLVIGAAVALILYSGMPGFSERVQWFWQRLGAHAGKSLKPKPALVSARVGFFWPEYTAAVPIKDAETLRFLEQSWYAEKEMGVPTDPLFDPSLDDQSFFWRIDLTWSNRGHGSVAVTRDGRLYDLDAGVQLLDPNLTEAVSERTRRLNQSFFGELLTWDEVRPLFPIGGTAAVRDLETGRTFTVYRHRGDAHADVEPLTARDSAVLKEIYGGEWSWKRRAVVVTVGGRRVAGSMNGMPHGWGDIFDNQFVGHSCIHFWQSRVHGTWRVDPGHQLMVLKAAGKATRALDEASPKELASWAVAAINHRDAAMLRYMAGGGQERFYALFSRLARPLRHITFIGAQPVSADEMKAVVEVRATVYYDQPDPDTGHARQLLMTASRRKLGAPWRVDLDSFLPLVVGKGSIGASDTATTGALRRVVPVNLSRCGPE